MKFMYFIQVLIQGRNGSVFYEEQKMKFLLPLLLLLTVSTSAREFMWLENVHKEYDELYSKLGMDNNYIAEVHFPHDNMEKLKSHIRKFNGRIFKLEKNQYYNIIKKCLFMEDGAYGRHLHKEDSKFLTKRFLRTLHKDFEVAPSIYKVEGIDFDIINNGCGVLLIGPLNHEAILLQGVSVD